MRLTGWLVIVIALEATALMHWTQGPLAVAATITTTLAAALGGWLAK